MHHDDAAPLGRSSVLDIYEREPRPEPDLAPGRFRGPCPTKLCPMSGCNATMELVLSHEGYPDSDPGHLLEWPYMYRRWVCQRDSGHWANVPATEWFLVQQFARERTAEAAPHGEWGLVTAFLAFGLVILILGLYVLCLPIKWAIELFRRPQRAEPVAESRPKHCSAPGCGGPMKFHPRQREADAPHTLEWPWHATWVCEKDASHFQVATSREELAELRIQR